MSLGFLGSRAGQCQAPKKRGAGSRVRGSRRRGHRRATPPSRHRSAPRSRCRGGVDSYGLSVGLFRGSRAGGGPCGDGPMSDIKAGMSRRRACDVPVNEQAAREALVAAEVLDRPVHQLRDVVDPCHVADQRKSGLLGTRSPKSSSETLNPREALEQP